MIFHPANNFQRKEGKENISRVSTIEIPLNWLDWVKFGIKM
jgi:hypothetical protein